MCGIVGVFAQGNAGFINKELDSLSLAMFLNTLRGRDSTGFFSVSNEGAMDWVKAVGPPAAVAALPKWEGFIKDVFNTGKLVIGHGRWATTGNVIEENAHPFEVTKPNGSKIVLVHNGTLEKHQSLPDFHKHDVDSAWMAQMIANHGYKEALGKINGAIATVWYDEEERMLYLFRNHQRPLHIGIGKNGTVLVTSESWPLWAIHRKHDIEWNKENVWEFAPGVLCKIPLDQIGQIKSSEDIETEEIERIYPKVTSFGRASRGGVPITLFEDDSKDIYDSAIDQARRRGRFSNWEPARTYANDLSEMVNGNIEKIAWKGTHMLTWFSKNGRKWISETQCPAHKANLVLMEPYQGMPGKVKMTYQTMDGTVYSHPVSVTEPDDIPPAPTEIARITAAAAEVIPILAAPKKERKEALPSGVRFRKGQGAKFKTRYDEGRTVVQHRVLSAPEEDRSFVKYANSIDGRFQVGDEVAFEATIVYEVGGIPKVEGWLLTPEGDIRVATCIKVAFLAPGCTKEYMEQFSLFKGKILSIGLTEDSDFKTTGTVVEFTVMQVESLDSPTEDKIVIPWKTAALH